ncbi:MAG: hypothetical protein M1826_005271 [Phylliscum demangeonii]|nr:MAG: hypothetical protein M1826_005271 [Phylliscum demangeonii]
MESPSPPSSLTGKCLCGGVRYTVHFPSPADWPPARNTCQCTQCRQWTGALVATFFAVRSDTVTWTHAPDAERREYQSSARCYRGFCTRCGSSLTWRQEPAEAEGEPWIEIAVGTVDEEVLLGPVVEGTKPADDGAVQRVGGLGAVLARPDTQALSLSAK